MDYNAWYQSAFPRLSGHGLWLRGGELNTIPAEQWESRPFRVLISRLSTFRDTVDSFTHTLLYQIAASIAGVYPDLSWLPPPRDAALFDREGVPWLLGATSKRSAREFGLVALSLSIVQELVNIATVLKKSGIPLSFAARANDPSCPLVILGGASALNTSALHADDPLVDGIFIGEDADTISAVLTICRDALAGGASRSDALERMRAVPGFFVPTPRPCTAVFHAPEIGRSQLLTNGPVLTDETVIGVGHLQISEGCACFCSFCAESFTRKPYRELAAPGVRNAALEAKKNMGVDDLDLYSFNFNMHRDLYAILCDLVPLFPSIGLKSQRFDSIARDGSLLDALHALGKTSLTCGLEGISPRLRRYLHKSLDEPALARALRAIVRAKVRELKIFLIATGLEDDADFAAWKEFVASLRSMMQAIGRSPRVIVSATPLVRFPGTPLEFEDAPSPGAVSAIMGRCGQIARNGGFEFRVSADASEYWLSQVLARAPDGRVGEALRNAAVDTGFVYYREIDGRFIDAFKAALLRLGMDDTALLAGSPPEARAGKPWAALDTGVSVAFLERQWRSAREFEDRGYCLGSDRREGACLACGACTAESQRAAIIGRRSAPPMSSAAALRAAVAAAREAERLVGFALTVLPKAAGLPRNIVGIALARAIMRSDERLVSGYRGYRKSWIRTAWNSDWVVGEERITLAWDAAALPALMALCSDPAQIERINTEMNGYAVVTGIAAEGEPSGMTLAFQSPFPFDPERYFREHGLKYTRRKTGEGSYTCDFSRESLKKKIVSAVTAAQSPQGWAVTVLPGPKFRLDGFVRSAFRLPAPEEWVRVEMWSGVLPRTDLPAVRRIGPVDPPRQ